MTAVHWLAFRLVITCKYDGSALVSSQTCYQ